MEVMTVTLFVLLLILHFSIQIAYFQIDLLLKSQLISFCALGIFYI